MSEEGKARQFSWNRIGFFIVTSILVLASPHGARAQQSALAEQVTAFPTVRYPLPPLPARNNFIGDVEELASAELLVRYRGLSRIEPFVTLSERTIALLINCLTDFRRVTSSQSIAGQAALVFAEHPTAAVRAIPVLLDLLSRTGDPEHYAAGNAARALQMIPRPALEDYLTRLGSDNRKALAARFIPTLNAENGHYVAWTVAAEIIGMLGPDGRAATAALQSRVVNARTNESTIRFAYALRVRAETALRIIEKGLRIGEASYYNEMKRGDAAVGKPDPYVSPDRRFAHAVETRVKDMSKLGVNALFIFRSEDTFPLQSFSGDFQPAAELIDDIFIRFLFPGYALWGAEPPKVPIVVLTTAAKEEYRLHYSAADRSSPIYRPYTPRVPDFAFVELKDKGREALEAMMKAVGIVDGLREDSVYEFWPSEWWPDVDRPSAAGRSPDEQQRLLWIKVTNGQVVGGAFGSLR